MQPAVALAALLCVSACSGKPAAAAGKDGTLVLELGGSADSLAATLRRAGVELLPPQVPPTADPADEQPRDEQGRAQSPADRAPGDRPPVPDLVPAPATGADWLEVEVKKGQTVMAIAQEYLGTTRRYREILRLNDMSEEQAKRIKPGDKLRVPKRAAESGK
jgi:nucleoid-associated protein YgaU